MLLKAQFEADLLRINKEGKNLKEVHRMHK